jgi:serine/threonine-protein kinase
VFTGEHDVYTGTDVEQIKTQTFGHLYGGSPGEPHLLQQTAAVFPSADQAEAFMTRSQTHWNACAGSDVDATLGYENGASYALSNVQRAGNVLTVAMATNGGLNGPDACQQAMGVRDNVVVEARTCGVPNVLSTYDPANGWPRDPDWAVPHAERIVKAILENVAS